MFMIRQRAVDPAARILADHRDAYRHTRICNTHAMLRSKQSGPRPNVREGILLAVAVVTLHLVPPPIATARAAEPAGDGIEATRSNTWSNLNVTDAALFGWGDAAPRNAGTDAQHGIAGLTLEPVAPQRRTELGLVGDVRGAVVASVAPHSAAAASGLMPGDVIVRVGDADAASPEDVARRIIAARLSGKSGIALLVVRGQTTYYLALLLTTR